MSERIVDYELIKKAQQGDQVAFEEIILKHKPLVYSLIKKYQYSSLDKEDLISVGTLGLIKAIKQFDTSFNVNFSTYAVPLILGEIKRYFRDDGAIKVSRQYKELYIRIQKAEKELEDKYLRKITIDDLVSYLNESIEDILMAIESHYYPTYLSNPLDEENLTLEDTLGENDVLPELLKMDLYDALEKLDDKEKIFINLRFFEGMKQQDIAKRFFVSQVQISRLERKILDKLKQLLVK